MLRRYESVKTGNGNGTSKPFPVKEYFSTHVNVGSGRIVEMDVLEDDVSRSFHQFLVVRGNVSVVLHNNNNNNNSGLVLVILNLKSLVLRLTLVGLLVCQPVFGAIRTIHNTFLALF